VTTPPDGHYLTQPLVAKAEMLIRRPVAEVFAAFVDPAVTTRFWFTKSSGPLTLGARVQWDWEMYGASTQVDVHAVEQDARILIVWDADAEPNSVEWRFDPRLDGSTFVSITNSGFTGDGDVVAAQALDSTGGFALVLAGLKAWLEHGIDLKLVPDRFPDGHV
jgi:uncharacterized protein YndB with AHSA1/START domain